MQKRVEIGKAKLIDQAQLSFKQVRPQAGTQSIVVLALMDHRN